MAEKRPKGPPRPPGLKARGRAFWDDVMSTWDLDRDEWEVLAEACRSLDLLDGLRAVLERDGLMVEGHNGQPRTHPAITQINATRTLLGRQLAQLGLPSEDGSELPSMQSVRAQKAARTRWAGHQARRGTHGA